MGEVEKKPKENLWKKLWEFTKKNWAYIIVAEIIFWADLAVIAIMAIFKPMLWAVFATVYGIQVTLLPAIPIQLGIAVGIKFLWEKIIKRFRRKNMRFKPKSTVHNPRALVYRRFIGLEKSINLATVYFTLTDSKYWTFDNETLEFSQIDASLIPTESVVTKITDLITILTYQGNYFRYTGTQWEKVNSLNTDITLLSATFNNIAKYQTNKYYYVGSFDYMIKGSVDGTTTQYIKGNIIPLTSLNIKYFDDSINLAVDDLVVIDKKLYSVENPETVKKMQPKAFNIYFATLNSIL